METVERPIKIAARNAVLDGDLSVPPGAAGLVIFAHGSGSSRFSERNRLVAARLRAHGMGTLLMDLLTPAEEAVDRRTAEYRFRIRLLADRLAAAADQARTRPETRELSVGLFGASTGAAAALIAAAERPWIAAVVSRGGRPDLAGDALDKVACPALLIVGGDDAPEVLRWNRESHARLRGPRALEIVAGATHLFEEEGALERAAELAAAWFRRYLRPGGPHANRG